MSSSDLTSRDWVAASTKQLIASLDASVSVTLEYQSNGGLKIRIQNISEETISRLKFLTNTDFNNNYLYLEDFSVYIKNSISPLDIPGIEEIANSLYKQSDIQEFLAGHRVKEPFAPNNLGHTSLPPGSTFNDLVDALTATIPYVQSTYGYVKTYEIVLNPDKGGLGAENITKLISLGAKEKGISTADFTKKFGGTPAAAANYAANTMKLIGKI